MNLKLRSYMPYIIIYDDDSVSFRNSFSSCIIVGVTEMGLDICRNKIKNIDVDKNGRVVIDDIDEV